MKKFLLFTLVLNSLLYAQSSVEVYLGNVWNMKEDITIGQNGQADIVINNASFQTYALEEPVYYGVRFSYKTTQDTAWEIEMNHMKLYLQTTHPDVQHLEVSHGYNLFWLNKAWYLDTFIFHVGAGFIIAHPDIIVRNLTNYKDGYAGNHLAGATVQTSIQKKFDISNHWFLFLEAKLVCALANIPIAQGSVVIPNRSLHADFGLGYNF